MLMLHQDTKQHMTTERTTHRSLGLEISSPTRLSCFHFCDGSLLSFDFPSFFGCWGFPVLPLSLLQKIMINSNQPLSLQKLIYRATNFAKECWVQISVSISVTHSSKQWHDNDSLKRLQR